MATTVRTDLAHLWDQAFKEYNEQVEKEGSKRNLKLRLDSFTVGQVKSIEDVKNAVTTSNKAFEKYRHSGSTLDKIRGFIGEHLSLVQTVGDNVASSASTAFPPAGAVWTVCTFAIKACQQQSDDYNQLLALIGETGNFLKTLKIIEDSVPVCKSYTEFVTETLTAIIGVFAVQTKLMLMKRPLVFLHTLVRGGDGDLAAAYGRVTEALTRLSRANEMMAIRNTEDLKTIAAQASVKMEIHFESVMIELQKQGEGIQENHKAILKNQMGIDAILQGMEADRMLLKQFKVQLMTSQTPEPIAQKDGKSKAVAYEASLAINKIRKAFTTDADPTPRFNNLSRSFVPDTMEWFFTHEAYASWISGKEPLLYLHAGEGQGKSHVAYALIEQLKRDFNTDEETSIAYFFFQEEYQPCRSVKLAIFALLVQIAEQDRRFREALSEELGDNDMSDLSVDAVGVEEMWNDIDIPEYYRSPKTGKLYLVFDDIDGAIQSEMLELLNILAKFADDSTKIKVCLTGNKPAPPGGLQCLTIQPSTRDTQDVKVKFMASRIESLPRLAKFRPAIKNQITSHLFDENFSLAYVERMLRNLDNKVLERPVLKSLRELPVDLSSLHEKEIATCIEGRSDQETKAISYLFSWLGACQRPMSLQEVNAILNLKFPAHKLDIEREIAERCASIIELVTTVSPLKQAQEAQKKLVDAQLRAAEATESNQSHLQTASKTATATASQFTQSDSLPLDLEDDSTYFLHFQDATMTRFIRGENSGVNQSSFEAHLEAFETCTTVALESESPQDPNFLIMRSYAAYAWMKHLRALTIREQAINCAKAEDVQRICNSLLSIYCTPENLAKMIQKFDDTCYGDLSAAGLSIVTSWLRRGSATLLASTSGERLSKARELCDTPESFLRPLFTCHVDYWMRQVLDKSSSEALTTALKSYQIILGEPMTRDVIKEREHFQDFVDSLKHEEGNYRFSRAIAIKLCDDDEHDDAWPIIQKAWEQYQKSPQEHSGTEEFFLRYWKAQIWDDASNVPAFPAGGVRNPFYKEAFDVRRPETPDERIATLAVCVRASAQMPWGESIPMLTSVLASVADPNGEILTRLFDEYIEGNHYREVVEAITRYGSLRLAFTDWYSWEINFKYQLSAKEAGMTEVMLATYESLIQQLEPLGWASPTKLYLAQAYRNFVKDGTKAKQLLNEVLDADGCFDPATMAENEKVVRRAQIFLSEIIYEQFLTTSSISGKMEHLQELKALDSRQLAGHMKVATELGWYATTLARMYQKLGPISEAVAILNADFDDCMDNLQDDDPYNDSATLRELCKVLSCVPGLEEDAAIALSASFYNVGSHRLFGGSESATGAESGEDADADAVDDSDVEVNDEPDNEADDGPDDARGSQTADGNADVGDEESDKEDEDLEDNPYLINFAVDDMECNGCQEDLDLTKPLYKCVICAECMLCEPCFGKIANPSPKYPYCATAHTHIKVPLPGWIGVKDKQIFMEGKDPLPVAEWLSDLRGRKWDEAWSRMLLG